MDQAPKDRPPFLTHLVRLINTSVLLGLFLLPGEKTPEPILALAEAILTSTSRSMARRLSKTTLTAPLKEALLDPMLGGPLGRVLLVGRDTSAFEHLLAEQGPAGLSLARCPSTALPLGEESFDIAIAVNSTTRPCQLLGLLGPSGTALYIYSLVYTPVLRPRIRRRLKEAGFARSLVRPSGLGTMAVALRQ